MGNLGKRQGKRPWAWRKFPRGCHGKKLRGKEKRKEKERKKEKNTKAISKDNKMVDSFIAQIKRY